MRRIATDPRRYVSARDVRTEQHGNLRLHTVGGVVAVVVVLAGVPWCAVTDAPDGGLMVVFAEDL